MHIGQIVEYWPQVKQRYSDANIRLMIIAPDIPYERRAYLEHFQIEFREIPLHIFQTFQEKATGRRLRFKFLNVAVSGHLEKIRSFLDDWFWYIQIPVQIQIELFNQSSTK